jgi:hypothetical protein
MMMVGCSVIVNARCDKGTATSRVMASRPWVIPNIVLNNAALPERGNAAPRRPRSIRHTVDRLTPASFAIRSCGASGFALLASITLARRSGDSRARPMVVRPAVNSIPARSATRQTVA